MILLVFDNFNEMANQVLVIRIKIPDGGDVDWTVHCVSQLIFRDVLVSKTQLNPHCKLNRVACTY